MLAEIVGAGRLKQELLPKLPTPPSPQDTGVYSPPPPPSRELFAAERERKKRETKQVSREMAVGQVAVWGRGAWGGQLSPE
jgi:hypothetical protein